MLDKNVFQSQNFSVLINEINPIKGNNVLIKLLGGRTDTIALLKILRESMSYGGRYTYSFPTDCDNEICAREELLQLTSYKI